MLHNVIKEHWNFIKLYLYYLTFLNKQAYSITCIIQMNKHKAETMKCNKPLTVAENNTIHKEENINYEHLHG